MLKVVLWTQTKYVNISWDTIVGYDMEEWWHHKENYGMQLLIPTLIYDEVR